MQQQQPQRVDRRHRPQNPHEAEQVLPEVGRFESFVVGAAVGGIGVAVLVG